jgi:hypothetical protein
VNPAYGLEISPRCSCEVVDREAPALHQRAGDRGERSSRAVEKVTAPAEQGKALLHGSDALSARAFHDHFGEEAEVAMEPH